MQIYNNPFDRKGRVMAARNGFVIALFMVMVGAAWGQPLDTLWTRTIDVPGTGIMNTVIPTTNGGFLMGGVCNYSLGAGPPYIHYASGDIAIVRLDSGRNIVWSRAIGAPDTVQTCWAATQTATGDYVLVGGSDISYPYSYESLAPTIVKVDSNGYVLWRHRAPVYVGEILYDVSVTQNGDYLFAGTRRIDLQTRETILIRTDTIGDTHDDHVER
jgi:hypothetical protein